MLFIREYRSVYLYICVLKIFDSLAVCDLSCKGYLYPVTANCCCIRDSYCKRLTIDICLCSFNCCSLCCYCCVIVNLICCYVVCYFVVIICSEICYLNVLSLSCKCKILIKYVCDNYIVGILSYICKYIVCKCLVKLNVLMNCLIDVLLYLRCFIFRLVKEYECAILLPELYLLLPYRSHQR